MRRRTAGRSIFAPLVVIIAVSLIVAACGGGAATPTSQPTAAPQPPAMPQPTAMPQATAVSPTATPRPTATTPATPVPTVGPTRGGVLTYPLSGNLRTRNPAKFSFFASYGFSQNVYSRIVRYNWESPPQKIMPDLALSWEITPDGKTYTFRFRPGLLWHDGKPFTSEDAKFSLENNDTRFAPLLEIIEGMQVPDQETLVIQLSKPQASFPSLLAHYRMSIFPKELYEAQLAADTLEQGPNIGTGPFTMKDFQQRVAVEVERNPNYFLPGFPYLDAVRAVVVRNPGTRLALFRAGRLDVLGTGATQIDTDLLGDLQRTNPDLQALPFDPLNPLAIIINSEVKPWDDVRVRRALFLAIDRWSAVEALPVLSKPQGPLVGPPGWGLSDEELFKLPGFRKGAELQEDRDEAKRLLADAGFPNGLDVAVIGSSVDYVARTLEFLVADLLNTGFRLKGGPVPSAEDTARRRSGDFEINVNGYSLSVPDPDGAALIVYPGSVQNKLDDARMQELFEQQSVEGDEAKRKDLVLQLQKRMMEVVNIVPIAGTSFWWPMQPEVRNLLPPFATGPNPVNDHVWLDR